MGQRPHRPDLLSAIKSSNKIGTNLSPKIRGGKNIYIRISWKVTGEILLQMRLGLSHGGAVACSGSYQNYPERSG